MTDEFGQETMTLDTPTAAGRDLTFICCDLPTTSGREARITFDGWVLSPAGDRVAAIHTAEVQVPGQEDRGRLGRNRGRQHRRKRAGDPVPSRRRVHPGLGDLVARSNRPRRGGVPSMQYAHGAWTAGHGRKPRAHLHRAGRRFPGARDARRHHWLVLDTDVVTGRLDARDGEEGVLVARRRHLSAAASDITSSLVLVAAEGGDERVIVTSGQLGDGFRSLGCHCGPATVHASLSRPSTRTRTHHMSS